MDTSLLIEMHRLLKNGQGGVLARIIHQKGSTPRGVGSCCIIDATGAVFGTIGGGKLEYMTIKLAGERLNSKRTALRTIHLNAKELEDDGMICGGMTTVYLEPILPDRQTLEFFDSLVQVIDAGGRGTLVTRIRDDAPASSPSNRLFLADGEEATLPLEFSAVPEQPLCDQLITNANIPNPLFIEPIQQEPELLLFGGGHIGTCVSQLGKMVGFRVLVFDDRDEFANRERFPEAEDIYAMPYATAFENIRLGPSSYVVIVTRGHAGDKDVLELVLNAATSPAYVGMIGSINKRNMLYKALLENGADKKTLAEIYSPIGLDIGAQTPAEIAIAIMAEIIQVKAEIIQRQCSVDVPTPIDRPRRSSSS